MTEVFKFESFVMCTLNERKNTFAGITLRTLDEPQTPAPWPPDLTVQCLMHQGMCHHKGLLVGIFQNPAPYWRNMMSCGAGAKIKS